MLYFNSLCSFTKQDYRPHALIIHIGNRHEKLDYLVHFPLKKNLSGTIFHLPRLFSAILLMCLLCWTRFPFLPISFYYSNFFKVFSIFIGHFSHGSIQLVLLQSVPSLIALMYCSSLHKACVATDCIAVYAKIQVLK